MGLNENHRKNFINAVIAITNVQRQVGWKNTYRTRLTHMSKEHGFEKKHQCQYCPSRFLHRDKLRVHERTHTGEKPFSCIHCDASFWKKICIEATRGASHGRSRVRMLDLPSVFRQKSSFTEPSKAVSGVQQMMHTYLQGGETLPHYACHTDEVCQ